jgi:hypothetical protein
MSVSKKLFIIAGGLSFAVALFQAVITFSPAWSRYFGAPAELVANIPLLYASGLIAAVFFAGFGLYALSGAGYIRPLPFLRLGLIGISGVYTLRGLFLIPQFLAMAGFVPVSEAVPIQGVASSLVALSIGLLYLAGTIGCWHCLGASSSAVSSFR